MRELLRSNRITVTHDPQGRFYIAAPAQPAQPATGEAVARCAVIAHLAGKQVWGRMDVLWARAVVEELEKGED